MIRITKFCLAIFCMTFVLTSCNLQKSNAPLPKLEYLEGASKFSIDQFFDSDLRGFAIILDNDDKIIDKIDITSQGSWSGNKGTVKFEYLYKNDRKDYRTWLITKQNSENFSIVGHDFVGSANGRQSGNVAELLYKMNYKFNGDEKEISFVDKVYQVNNSSVIAITELYHKNKKVGKIISSFVKVKTRSTSESKEGEVSQESSGV